MRPSKWKRMIAMVLAAVFVLTITAGPAMAANRVTRTTTFSCASGQQVRIQVTWKDKTGSPKIEVGWIDNVWIPRKKTSATLPTSTGTYTVWTGTQRLRSLGVGWTAYGQVVGTFYGNANLTGIKVACVAA